MPEKQGGGFDCIESPIQFGEFYCCNDSVFCSMNTGYFSTRLDLI